MTEKKYDPLGRCLYCNSGGPLSDEHIIAYSLGGTLVLPKASCAACAGVTSYIDGVCGRALFGPVRTHLQIQTRRKKDRPKALPVSVTNQPDLAVLVDEHPFYLTMQEFERPGILNPLQHVSKRKWAKERAVKFRLHTLPDTHKRHVKLGDVGVPMTLSPDILKRMVAKVAHAFAGAEFGMDAFDPLLADVILGKSLDIDYLVGNVPGANNDTDKYTVGREVFHVLELRVIRSALGARLLCGYVCLFTNFAMPVYEVVLGAPNRSFPEMAVIAKYRQLAKVN